MSAVPAECPFIALDKRDPEAHTDTVALDESFQDALQSYAHRNGSSHRVAAAAIRALIGAQGAMGIFMYKPQAPEIPDDYPTQRWFKHSLDGKTSLVRRTHEETAELSVCVALKDGSASVSRSLTKTELRVLARHLLEAAHDIETIPATAKEMQP